MELNDFQYALTADDFGSFTVGDYTFQIRRVDSYSFSDKGPGRHEFSIEISGLVTETPAVSSAPYRAVERGQ